MIKSRFLRNDRTPRLSWKEACFGSHLRTSVKTVQGMCSERKMRFLGHPAFAAQHMLLHNGMHPPPSSRGSEYFMSLLNGERIDDGTPEKSAIGFSIFYFSRQHFSDCQLNACHGLTEKYLSLRQISRQNLNRERGMCAEVQRRSALEVTVLLFVSWKGCGIRQRSRDPALLTCLEFSLKDKDSICVCFVDMQDLFASWNNSYLGSLCREWQLKALKHLCASSRRKLCPNRAMQVVRCFSHTGMCWKPASPLPVHGAWNSTFSGFRSFPLTAYTLYALLINWAPWRRKPGFFWLWFTTPGSRCDTEWASTNVWWFINRSLEGTFPRYKGRNEERIPAAHFCSKSASKPSKGGGKLYDSCRVCCGSR